MTQPATDDQLLWARPGDYATPRDQLRVRLDIYSESIVMQTRHDHGINELKMVSAADITAAFSRHRRFHTGLLPADTLWCQEYPNGATTALWRPPRIWPAALLTAAFQPPQRFRLPLPGLIFVCQPGRPPRIFAAPDRPRHPEDPVFHAPVFNTFRDGSTCPGNHTFPQEVNDIPESFFTAFFTLAGNADRRSRRHPDNLLELWREIDGTDTYPNDDLMPCATVAEIMGA